MSISHSEDWKAELLVHLEQICAYRACCIETRDFFPIERSLVLAALCTRKVFEARFVPENLRTKTYSVITYPSKDGRCHGTDAIIGMNEDLSVDKLFNLDQPLSVQLDAYEMSSEFIHCADMTFGTANGRIEAVYLASFRNEYKRLLELQLDKLIEIFKQIIYSPVRRRVLVYEIASKSYRVFAE